MSRGCTAHIHTQVRAHTHTHTHTNALPPTHTHTHTHTWKQGEEWGCEFLCPQRGDALSWVRHGCVYGVCMTYVLVMCAGATVGEGTVSSCRPVISAKVARAL